MRNPFRKKPILTRKQSDLGNVLLKMGVVTEDQISKAVEVQHQGEQAMLGAILVGAGVIDGETLGKALVLQEKLRTGKETEAMLDIVQDATARVRLKIAG